MDTSPLAKIPKPKVLAEQVQPFTQGQIEALLKAARSSLSPKRDEAMFYSSTTPACERPNCAV